MNMPLVAAIAAFVFLLAAPQHLYAYTQDDIDFASGLEETLGHFWALELNLDEGNAELAITHANHPIEELYVAMKPVLQDSDPALDTRVQTTLVELRDKASTDVSRAEAQAAIEDAKEIVQIARDTIVGPEISADPHFKLELMRILIETSIAEYGEAISDGEIVEMAEFQDGSAFVWRAEQILDTITEIDSAAVQDMKGHFDDLNAAYDARATPDDMESHANAIITAVDDILGSSGDTDLLTYVDNIRTLLTDAKAEYRAGNTDVALSYVTRAYLDNYEFLEGPLVDAGERDLMVAIEIEMREELRAMIRDGASPDEVDAHVDMLLEQMETVAVIVPEFEATVLIILSLATLSAILLARFWAGRRQEPQLAANLQI